MTEGNVFITTWIQTDDGYRVWVKKRPKLAAEGATFEEADALLIQVIGLATGDGENTHEYVPPAPAVSPDVTGRDEVVLLGIQAQAEMGDPVGLFEGGLCTNCLMPRGARTGAPLTIRRVGARTHAATVRLPNTGPGTGPDFSIYSAAFLDALTEAERAAFEWRAVTLPKSAKQEYFELVRGPVQVRRVGLRDRQNYHARCDSCGHVWMVPKSLRGAPFFHLSAADVPPLLPSLFATSGNAGVGLGATVVRWAELVGTPTMKDIKSSRCPIVNEELVDRPVTFEPRPPEPGAATAPGSWFQ